MKPVRPKRLRPGDRVAVIAPAGPVPRETFAAGVALLGKHFELGFTDELFTATGFLAGSDERRRAELCAALAEPSVRAVWCARGGYGTMRLLQSIDAQMIANDRKPLIGFSDITALHAAWLGAGTVTLHGPHPTQLGKLEDPAAGVADLLARLVSPEPPPAWTGLRPLGRSDTGSGSRSATGIALGGNLEMVTRLLGTPWWPELAGAVLFLEDVGEPPYKLDRQLTQLRLAGALSQVAAIVLGEFIDCDLPARGQLAADVLAERLGDLPIPILSGGPFGHGARNRAFPLGARVTVDASAGTVTFLEGAVA